jgi:prepilin-type N-terminal cleavage/methylation domain-containing protein
MKRRTSRGFTLTEMMIVVAIVGILTTVAAVSVRTNTRPVDVAGRFAGLVQTGSRSAVRIGVVRSDVATTEGSKRRARITASGTTHPLFTLEVLSEDPTPAWTVLSTYQVPTSVDVVGFTNTVSTHSAATTISTDWNQFVLSFEPSGSSNSVTLFLSADQGATQNRKARISVLPLGTATFVRESWE